MQFLYQLAFTYILGIGLNFTLDYAFRGYMRKYNYLYILLVCFYVVMITEYYSTKFWFDCVCILAFTIGTGYFQGFMQVFFPRTDKYLSSFAWNFRDKN